MPAAVSPINDSVRSSWVQQVISAPDPADTLLKALEELDGRQDLGTQAALFEAVLSRIDTRHYWVYFRMARVYAELAREDASFQMAALAVQMHAEWDASHAPFQILFRYFVRRGDARGALDVFLRQISYFPERPIADRSEVEPLLRALGVDPHAKPPAPASPPGASAAPRVVHRVIEAEIRPATPVPVVGGQPPHGLAKLSFPMQRREIDVVELHGGELLVCNDTVVVCTAEGIVEPDLSVGDFPELIARRVLQPGAGETVEQHAVEHAVLILDGFPPPNLCHFLFDQIARLELYRRAGADLAHAMVVGPELRTDYQRAIAARAGMTQPLGAARIARVWARHLWVSTDCRALLHPAHYGAGWAVGYARALLGGRGAAGTRRLYLSRADTRVRHVLNEAELMTELARFGFESIVPGALPYDEQLELFRSASHVVGAHGAALAHIALCPPGARVLELFHPLYGTWAYAMLAAECGLDYSALTGRDGVSDAPELNDPSLVDLAAGRFGDRHIRVDPALVRRWMEMSA